MTGRPADAGAASRRMLFGTDEPLPASLPLRAGPLALALRDGALRDLAWHGRAAWTGVTFPFRDADWWTPPFAVEGVARAPRPDGFRVEVRGGFAVRPRLRTTFAAEGDGAGRLRVEAEAVPDADLPTNRTGLCLLAPSSAGGDPCEIEHVDGRVSRSTFPTLVAPWPPFVAIRAIRRRIAPGCWAHCVFSGDSFEFEDQRNNADASFKVYSRSNMMPRPYLLRAGVPVRQAMDLSVEGAPRRRPARPAPVAAPGGALPRLGLAASPGGDLDLLRRVAGALRPDFIHASLDLDALVQAPAGLAALADAGGSPLRLELTLDGREPSEADLAPLRAVAPEAVALFPSRPRSVEALRRTLPAAAVGGGTPHFFAQINRLEELGPVDHLTFTLSPLVHGAADDDVMLCPGSLPGLAATLARRWPGLPIHLGPSGIAMRASPLGRQPPSDGRERRAMAGDDPRARGLFGAAWVLAVVAACTRAGFDAVTLMAAEGPSGVAERRGDALAWHPVSAVLARLGGGGVAVPVPAARAPCLAALAFRRGGARQLLLANLGPEPMTVALEGWAAGAACGVLDEASLRDGASGDGPPRFAPRPAAPSLMLTPYAVASLAEGPGSTLERST